MQLQQHLYISTSNPFGSRNATAATRLLLNLELSRAEDSKHSRLFMFPPQPSRARESDRCCEVEITAIIPMDAISTNEVLGIATRA